MEMDGTKIDTVDLRAGGFRLSPRRSTGAANKDFVGAFDEIFLRGCVQKCVVAVLSDRYLKVGAVG